MGTFRSCALLLIFGIVLPACERSLPLSYDPDLSTPPSNPDLVVQAIPDLTPPPDAAPPCAAESGAIVRPQPDRLPIDIILVVDDSPTMGAAIRDIEATVNQSFAKQLDLSGVDYRIILISRFGDRNNQGICIGPPLSGNNCVLPKGPPVNGARFFQYDLALNGPDVLDRLLASNRSRDPWGLAPNGWSGLLRKNTSKFFVVVSDDNAGLGAANFRFMLQLTDPAMFGAKADLVFHVVVGLNSAKTLGPKDPLEPMACGNARNNGAAYQELAIMTGGLRFSICLASFNAIFKELTKDALTRITLPPKIPCETDLPIAPPGMILSSMKLDYLPSAPPMAPPVMLQQVMGPLACLPSSFYMTPNTFALCPDTCAQVQKDAMGQLQAVFCWNRP